MEGDGEQWRPWSSLPQPALVAVMRNLEVDDRLNTVPHVCMAWCRASKSAKCWESMFTDEQTTDATAYHLKTKSRYFYDRFFRFLATAETRADQLRSLINKSEGKITSLFVHSFLSGRPREPEVCNHKEVLRLIACSCPHLKHLSVEGIYQASPAAMHRVILNCKELEIIDFSDSTCFSSGVVADIGRHCPKFFGLRTELDDTTATAIGKHLPMLKCLAVCGGPVTNEGLKALLTGCRHLEYLSILLCPELDFDEPALRAATARIPEFSATGSDALGEMFKALYDMMFKAV